MLVDAIMVFNENGLPHESVIVFPGGSGTNPEVKEYIKDIVGVGLLNYQPSDLDNNDLNNKWTLGRTFITFDDTKTVAYWKSFIDGSVSQKKWTIFGTHSNQLKTTDFAMLEEVIAYAKSKAPFRTFEAEARLRRFI